MHHFLSEKLEFFALIVSVLDCCYVKSCVGLLQVCYCSTNILRNKIPVFYSLFLFLYCQHYTVKLTYYYGVWVTNTAFNMQIMHIYIHLVLTSWHLNMRRHLQYILGLLTAILRGVCWLEAMQDVMPELSTDVLWQLEQSEWVSEWVSEQFLNGTSAHRRPCQCHSMVLRLKTKYI